MSSKKIQKILWFKKSEYIEVERRTGHEGSEEDQRYSSILNLGAKCVLVVNDTPLPLYPRESPGTHCIGG
jgi:hypothetical protein